jgi:hypothetical protein
LPKISGLAKVRAENRLKSVGESKPAVPPKQAEGPVYLAVFKPDTIRVLGNQHSQLAATPELAPQIIREPFALGGRNAEHGVNARGHGMGKSPPG